LPFMSAYLNNHAFGAPSIPYHEAYQIMEQRYGYGFLNIPHALLLFILHKPERWLFWFLAIVGVVLLRQRQKIGRDVRSIGIWALGLAISSLFIPYVEQLIARSLQLIPVEVDLVRGIRYFVPIMLLFCLWPLVERSKQFETSPIWVPRFGIASAGFLLVLLWVVLHPPVLALRGMNCWLHGRLVCMEKDWPAAIDALGAVQRKIPPNATILPVALSLEIRYVALRSVLFSGKDGGLLSYVDHDRLAEWHRQLVVMEEAAAEVHLNDRLRRYVEVGNKLKAQYLLVDFPVQQSDTAMMDVELLWQNSVYSLVKL
ncbi:MAG: hypothetical protein Q7S23_05170, partial [bacterium]|nr:hypothetical protein [bacterium]